MGKRPASKTEQSAPEQFLPLTPAVFHILVALGDGESHGYAIMQDVLAKTGGAVRLSAGTLYGAVSRLLEDGLIEELDSRPDPEMDDARRRYYRLSNLGGRVLHAESNRLTELVRTARATRVIRKLRTV
jgi:DNA-binding PadR family transcriptional regulator